MAISPGARIGGYEIIGSLGAGGMGEVYRARDTKLDRDVAIKILPESLASDPDRLMRFEREAKTLASLNHPHIAQIHGFEDGRVGRVGQVGRVSALVMELVEGEELAERIARGVIPIDEAIAIACQVADALEAAHEQGIIHRDLKPANIKVRADGTVKVLDFGLAKALGRDARPETQDSRRQELTVTSPAMTAAGVILGTASYMAPEQARGKSVDKRADIWAFGCVLFEMLSGRRSFAGETTADVIAKIVAHEPDWTALPKSLPANVRWVLRRCFEKDPRRRLRDIGDARHELESVDRHVAATPPSSLRVALLTVAVAAVALIAGFSLATTIRRPASTAPPEWASAGAVFSIDLPIVGGAQRAPGPNLVVSDDGRYIAGQGRGSGIPTRIWVYTIATGDVRELEGTEGANSLFWSPDARALGFFAQGDLRILDLASGNVRRIANLPEVSSGASWSAEDVIVFSARYALYQIPAGGGTPKVVAELNPEFHENSLRFPRFLPDGRRFLYVARSGRSGESGVYVGSLDAKPVRLFSVTSDVAYSPPGYLLYAEEGALLARSFDLSSLQVGATPALVAPNVGAMAGGMNGHFAVSRTGVLAYYRRPTESLSTLRWHDRTGKPIAPATTPARYATFHIAPDDDRIAVDLANPQQVGRDVWVLTPPSYAATRVTFGGTDDWQPMWFPDGKRLAFMTYRSGVGHLYVKSLNGAFPEEPLVQSRDQAIPGNVSADGKLMAYWTEGAESRGDVWVLNLDSKQMSAIAQTKFIERRPRVSPDGHFIAYESDEGGAVDVYVQPVPATGGKWQVSTGGGAEVEWRRDGRELYFVKSDGTLMAVPAKLSPLEFSAGAPTPLFSVGRQGGGGVNRYDVAGDGQRFLIQQFGEPQPQPVTVMLNWLARLKP